MRIAPDKWKHFWVGVALGLLFQMLGFWLLPGHSLAVAVANILAVCIIAYGFELYSKFTGRGHYEVMDAVASVIGGLLGLGIALVV
jgi:VanZ family protein